MFTTIRNFMTAMAAPADEAYATIIYPARGVAVVVHDGLGIAQERPWYQLPAIKQERLQPFDMQPVDDDLGAWLAQFEDSNAEFGYSDVPDDLLPSTTGFACDTGDYLVDLDSPFFAGKSASGLSLFGGIGSFDNAGFMDGSELLGVNPASGLPMMDSCFDVGGNPFGMS